jgi:hypothetical protein
METASSRCLPRFFVAALAGACTSPSAFFVCGPLVDARPPLIPWSTSLVRRSLLSDLASSALDLQHQLSPIVAPPTPCHHVGHTGVMPSEKPPFIGVGRPCPGAHHIWPACGLLTQAQPQASTSKECGVLTITSTGGVWAYRHGHGPFLAPTWSSSV